ncbi:MAG: hypothetical protein IJE18_00120 [Bacteroidaceae bacterium]|nr:hypothetical protein [Bacteroidaceae bacterium]
MNKYKCRKSTRIILFLLCIMGATLPTVATEPNVWLYKDGCVTHEIDADSIAVVESDVPVFPGTKGLVCISRYINDTTTTDTERVLYVDGKEVELIDPETGIEYLFKNAAVDGLGNLYILGNSNINNDYEQTLYCMWKNGEIWWKETVSNYGGFFDDIIFDGENVYTHCVLFPYSDTSIRQDYYYKKNDEELIYYSSGNFHPREFKVVDDIIYYASIVNADWNGSGYHSLNSWYSWIQWFYIYDDINGGRWITRPDFSYWGIWNEFTFHKGKYYIAGGKYNSIGDNDITYYSIISNDGESVCDHYKPQKVYFDDNDNMWVLSWLIDEDKDGIDDYYGLETKGVHFWKNGSYYGRVLYQNLVTEDENDTENIKQMFMHGDDFYAIMSIPSRDDNGNEIRVKSALIRNEKTIWVIDGFINKVLFY